MRVAVADIETASAKELHSFGPEYFRLGAVKYTDETETRVTTDPREMISWLLKADGITGHNWVGFDAMALAKYYSDGRDDLYEELCRKAFDTQIAEQHVNPVKARGHVAGYYRLGPTAVRYGAPDKTDHLPRLARKHGGFHLIPQDNAEYISYLRGDIDAQEGLFNALHTRVRGLPPFSQGYLRREHAVATVTGRASLEGFRVDVDETLRRDTAGRKRLEQYKKYLHEQHGMPLEGKKPHTTNVGKAAFRRALLSTGISEAALDANWPKTKDGSLQMGKEVLKPMVELFEARNPEAATLCRTILEMNGVRSIYGTVLDHLVGDRVHPYIGPDQASGRWSVKDPGLTVFGKNEGKAAERSIMLADSDDEVLVSIDLDQVDARAVAGLSGDTEYAKFFEPGRDLHSEVALRVFNRNECRIEMARNNGRCDCEYRTLAKVCGHGWNYSQTPKGLAKRLGLDLAVTEGFDRGMSKAFPRLCEWKQETRQAAGVLGWDEEAPSDDVYRILYTGYGRPVRVERNRAYTQATALLGQGTTRDLMAEIMLRLPKGTRRRIRAVIHDEFIFSLPKEGAQETAKKIAESMTLDFRGIPITAGCSRVSRNWGGCYGEKYETAA